VPRVLNVALAVVLLLLVAPIVTQFDGKRWYVQVVLLSVTVPTVLLALACLGSAARPGSLGRAVRRLRARRRR
jgi:ABC-type tungstate transport system substrate-binding protein